MRCPLAVLLALVWTGCGIGIVWGTEWPLGVPGEWVWTRVSHASSLGLTFALLAIVGGCYLGWVWLGARRIDRATSPERAVWLMSLALAGFGWLWFAQEGAPDGYQLSKAVWVLYFPGSSGYFTEARGDSRPVGQFLAEYEERMREGDVLHVGTHPPGLILLFRGLLPWFGDSPRFTATVELTIPESVRSSFESLPQGDLKASLPLTRVEQAVLWSAAVLAHGLAALTVVPLYGLMRRHTGPRAAWMAAALWPAAPAVAVFLPKSDAAFPCLAMTIVWLWCTGVDRRSWWRCGLVGVLMFLALGLSLAFLPVAWLALLCSFWSVRSSPPMSAVELSAEPTSTILRRLGSCGLLAAIGLALPLIFVWWKWGINLLAVWRLNLINHAGFYRLYPRTYWKWLLVNPLEFAFAAGFPLVVVALAAIVRNRREWKSGLSPAAFGFLATWGLLWLSGKNMGEAARLWIFLIPCLVWLAADWFEAPGHSSSESVAKVAPVAAWGWLVLGMQLAASAALVTRVAGFRYQ
ncbi:MAG: hypothetical protein ACKV0T_12035 [Planctomycetales bacterium]